MLMSTLFVYNFYDFLKAVFCEKVGKILKKLSTNCIKWDEWDEMDGMDGMGWDGMGWDGMGWTVAN